MTRQEYINQYTSCKTEDQRTEVHLKYYLEMARENGVKLPDELKDVAAKSNDRFFNDYPINLWDYHASWLKMYQKVDLFEGVCILKALAEKERRSLGIFIK